MSEFRKDPIIDRWIIITQNRMQIKIKNNVNNFLNTQNIAYEKKCPFCEGNEIKTPTEILAYSNNIYRKKNEKGWNVRVVPDKNVILKIEENLTKKGEGIYDKIAGFGAHEIIIETPKHVTNIYDLDNKQIETVFIAFKDRILDLKKDSRFQSVLIYKNSSENFFNENVISHSHSHLIALPIIPRNIKEEISGAEEYFKYKGRCIYCDIIDEEIRTKKRIVYETSDFIAFCPFASKAPFEIWILPKNHSQNFEYENNLKLSLLAKFFKIITKKLTVATGRNDFYYVLHNSPLINFKNRENIFHWHIEIISNINNVAGFEKGSGFYINPVAPETCAEYMRNLDI